MVAVYGTSHLFSIWNINRDYRLTFGQVVPLVMLFAPFFILWDHFVGRWPSTKSNIIARGTDNGVEASPTQTLDVNGLLTQPAPVRSPTTARALYYAPLDSLISTEPSAVTGSIRLHRLAEAESGSFCTISVLPLLQMPQGSRDNRHPSLGRFEILPWFSYLMPQLFAAGTLLIFLRINPVDIIGDSAVSVFIASEMLLVLGMESQLLFILMWPRDPYSFGLAQCMSPKYRKLLYGCLSSLFVLVFFGVSIFLLAPFLFPLYSDPWFLKAAWYCLTVLYIIFCIVWALVLPHGKSTRVLARGSDQTIALEGIPADQRPVEV